MQSVDCFTIPSFIRPISEFLAVRGLSGVYYRSCKITGTYREQMKSTYDDSVGGDVQGSCSEDRGGRRATPTTGLLVGRV